MGKYDSVENLLKIAECAELELCMELEKFEARKPAYQEGFTPAYVTSAQKRYKRAVARYEAAVVAQAEADAREDSSK